MEKSSNEVEKNTPSTGLMLAMDAMNSGYNDCGYIMANVPI